MRIMQALSAALLLGVSAAAVANTEAPAPSAVLRGATILDGKGGVIRNKDIIVVDGKIMSIGGTAPADAKVYDLRKFTILPGMIDTHEHVFYHFRDDRFVDGRLSGLDESPEEAILYGAENGYKILMAGFTTIQSPGRFKDRWLRDAYARNILPGPRVLTSLEWLRFDPPGSAPAPEQIRQIVRERKDQGADFIKLFANASGRDGSKPLVTQAQLDALCDEANKLGIRTLIHAYNASVKMAVQAKCTTVEHGSGGMTPEVIDMMVKNGTYYDPNVGLVGRNYVENKEKYIGIGNYTAESFATMEARMAENRDPVEFMAAVKNKDLKIVYGTDAVAGAHGRNGLEFVYRVERGKMDPMRAVVALTSMSAESLGLGDKIGTIAPGFEADIVALEGDPLKDPEAVMHVSFVMKGGKVYKSPIKP